MYIYCVDLGRIIKFANSKEAVVKWVLNGPFQCKYVKTFRGGARDFGKGGGGVLLVGHHGYPMKKVSVSDGLKRPK